MVVVLQCRGHVGVVEKRQQDHSSRLAYDPLPDLDR
jgi:hypothetical protein